MHFYSYDSNWTCSKTTLNRTGFSSSRLHRCPVVCLALLSETLFVVTRCRQSLATVLNAQVDCVFLGSLLDLSPLSLLTQNLDRYMTEELIGFSFLRNGSSACQTRQMVVQQGNIKPITDDQISHRCRQTNACLQKSRLVN